MVKISKKINKLIRQVLYWIFVLFLVYLIYELVRKLLGGSLGFEEVIIGLLIANLGYSFQLNAKLSGHIGWHKGRNSKIK